MNDVHHPGVSNGQLVKEDTDISVRTGVNFGGEIFLEVKYGGEFNYGGEFWR